MSPNSHPPWRAIAIAAVILLTLPAALEAALKPMVQVTLKGEPQRLVPGERYEGTFVFEAQQPLDVSGLRLEGEGWSALTLATTDFPWLELGDRAELSFSGIPSRNAGELRLSFESLGVEKRESLDLSDEAFTRMIELETTEATEATVAGFASKAGVDELPEPVPPRRRSFQKPVQEGERLGKGKNITISGRFVYVDSNGLTRGADGVTVRVYDEDWDWDEYLGGTITNTDGYFSRVVYASEGEPDLYLEYEAANSEVHLERDSILEENYVYVSPVHGDYTGTNLNFGTRQPGNTRGMGVLHILSTLTRAWRWNQNRGYDPPKVDCQFPEDDYQGAFYDGEIHIGWNRMWRESSAVHEYGHHWVHAFAVAQDPDYDNGICINGNGNDGHCLWCQETGHDAWNEGFPDWFSQAITSGLQSAYGVPTLNQYNFEGISACLDNQNPAMPCACNPTQTEGFLASLLWDIFDDASEGDDGNVAGTWDDALSMGSGPLLQVADQLAPLNPVDFIQKFKSANPNVKEAFWMTARNCGYDLDASPPGKVTNIQSTDHQIGVSSPDATISYTWNAPSDDFSGAGAYSVSLASVPVAPSLTANVFNQTTWTSPPKLPGQYWFSVRALDRAGRWSSQWESYGPITIREPYPADHEPWARAGWDEPLIVRNAPDVTLQSAPMPQFLDGDQNTTYWNLSGRNAGELPTQQGFWADFIVDGEKVHNVFFPGVVQPYVGTFVSINQGPFTIRGGRHTLELFVESHEDENEHDETNNIFGMQLSWFPITLFSAEPYVRAAPPLKKAGWESVPFLNPVIPPPGFDEKMWYNQDGLRMSLVPRFGGDPFWGAVSVHSVDDDVNVDAYMEYPMQTAVAGFTGSVARSERSAGLLDAVIANGWNATNLWDVGVVNVDDAAADYVANFARSLTVPFGTEVTVDFDENQMLMLREFQVNSLGWIQATIQHDPAAGPFVAKWLSADYVTGELGQFSVNTVTQDGEARLDVLPTQTGRHCLVIYRDPKWAGTAAANLTLSVESMPADLVAAPGPGWELPLVAQDAVFIPGTAGAPVLPSILPGDEDATYFSFNLFNDSPTASAELMVDVELDGVPVYSHQTGDMLPYQQLEVHTQDPVLVPGGRHVLTLRIDPLDAQPERNEENNEWSRQFSWRPGATPTGQPVIRRLPAAATYGWDLIDDPVDDPGRGKDDDPEGGDASPVRWLNCDGLETEAFVPEDQTWIGVAAMPGAGNDVDLNLYAHDPDPVTAFGEPLVESNWGDQSSEFVLVNLALAGDGPFHAGAVLVDAGDAASDDTYTAEVVAATSLGSDPTGTLGTFTLGAGHILALHELQLSAGVLNVVLQNVSGSVNWGVSLYAPDGTYLAKSDAFAHDWLPGAGGEEDGFSAYLAQPGTYCLAVWKVDQVDLDQAGEYDLSFASGTGNDDHPGLSRRSGLVSIHPNPFNPRTVIDFSLRAAGPVDLAIYNARGERVATLERGPREPGEYSRRWEGIDDGGNGVPSGVYFVRLVTLDSESRRKITLVK